MPRAIGPTRTTGDGETGQAGSSPSTRRASRASVGDLLAALVEAVGAELAPNARKQLAHRLLRYTRKRRSTEPPILSIARLCDLFCEHADNYYRQPDLRGTSEAASIRVGLAPLRKLFGRRPATDLGPRRLMQVREAMIAKGWTRKYVNQQINRIKRMFKWAVANELVPASLHHALTAVCGLRAGRSAAPESEPVKPVPEPLIEAILPYLPAQVQAMIKLQLLTGMRPGEVLIMRSGDIDRTVTPWLYRPSHHKTEHHQHERLVFLGPKAQAIVQPFLKPEQPDTYLFSPADVDRERRERRHGLRRTPLSCGNIPGSNRKRRPKKMHGDRYGNDSYYRTIRRGCELAFPVPPGLDADQAKQWRREHYWHPHQLRHNAATQLRKEHGIDVAQVVLGHKTLAVTQVYAEKNVAAAQKVMLEIG